MSGTNGKTAGTNGNGRHASLSLEKTFRGKKLVVIGGTGFLGKVFWALLLSRYPSVSRLYLLVRPKKGQTLFVIADEVAWSEAGL